MGKFAKFLQVLTAADQVLDLAEQVARLVERLIPGQGKGIAKKELGMVIMERAREENANPDSLALDMAVAKLNVTQGWEKPIA